MVIFLILFNTVLILVSLFVCCGLLLLILSELRDKKDNQPEECPKFTPFEDLPVEIGDKLYMGGLTTKQQATDATDAELIRIGFVPGEITKIREDLS